MIYLIRHGQTDWNKEKVMQGQTDIPLNATGIGQANIVGEKLTGIKFDYVFCSPLLRTQQTLKNLNIPITHTQLDNRLKERNYGEFERTSKSSFDYNEFWSLSANKQYKKAECCKDFFERVTDFIKDLKELPKDCNILVVTHAGITKVFKYYFEGLADDQIGPYLPDNCGVMTYNF